MNINSYCFRRVLATLALIVLFALFIAFFALLRPVSVVCGCSMNPTFSDFCKFRLQSHTCTDF